MIQVFRSSFLTNLAEKQQTHVLRIDPQRGTIYDRKMRPLALDVAAYSLYADPRMMKAVDIAKAIELLPSLAGLDKGFLRDRLTGGVSQFIAFTDHVTVKVIFGI